MSKDFKRACVTGGAGFIGSKLAAALLDRGIEVRVIDDLSVGKAANVPAGAELITGSILDRDLVSAAIDRCDVVFHLAARVAIRSSFDFLIEDTQTNVAGTATVLRAAQQSGSVRRVVATSSMAVYSDSPDGRLVAETHPPVPISPYGASKLCSEFLTHQMCAASGIDSVVVRLFNTYGVGQRLSPYVGVITIFCNRLAAGERPTIFGDGEQRRDFVHVSDIVRGFLCALEAPVTGETFNIGTGVATSVNHVLAQLQKVLGTSLAPVYAPAVAGELRHSVADIAKARRLLGYEPQQVFASAVASVAEEIVASSRPAASIAALAAASKS